MYKTKLLFKSNPLTFAFANCMVTSSQLQFYAFFLPYIIRRTGFMWENDFIDVEANRVDVCFNQVFSAKEDALKCLEYQKRLMK